MVLRKNNILANNSETVPASYDLHDWDRQGQRWLVYTPAYSTAGLGQKASGPFCPAGPSYPIFPTVQHSIVQYITVWRSSTKNSTVLSTACTAQHSTYSTCNRTWHSRGTAQRRPAQKNVTQFNICTYNNICMYNNNNNICEFNICMYQQHSAAPCHTAQGATQNIATQNISTQLAEVFVAGPLSNSTSL